jgi:cytosine/adenosine deaminase-related metal-dependent hydrolase
VRAGAGTDERASSELQALAEAGVLRQNTVIVHGTALSEADAPRLLAARAAVVWCPEVDARLFEAQPPVGALLREAVPVALGSGGASCGGRDLLSALAAARGTGLVGDDALLDLAGAGGAKVARLPLGGFAPGDPADFVAVDSPATLLAGSRAALHLVVVAGRARVGEPSLIRGLEPKLETVEVDGTPRALERSLAARLRTLRARLRRSALPGWLESVVLQSTLT